MAENNFLKRVQLMRRKSLVKLKKNFNHFSKTVKPFLAVKYWAVYLTCFIVGFYFWGPWQGGRKLVNWWSQRNLNTSLARVKSLEQELTALKKSIQKTKKNVPLVESFSPESFVRPGAGEVIQGFDWRKVDGSWRLHPGVDLALAPKSNALAAAAGIVNKIERNSDGSFTIILNHGDSWQSIYSGLKTVNVTTGQKVLPGVILGLTGMISCLPQRSGFHFGIHHQGEPVDPSKLIGGLEK